MVRAYLKKILMLMVAMYVVACSPVKFDKLPEQGDCQNVGGQRACIQTCDAQGNCFAGYDLQKQVGQEVADILIVNDNSGSMSPEQQKMADQFPTFINSLGNINFRIAMTTTDVSGVNSNSGVSPMPSSIRDGALIEFSSGVKFLTPAMGLAQADNLFKATVKRQETLNCEANNFSTSQCPSSDERGIYAANLAAMRNDGSFLRADGHLAVIVLADEDVRSNLYCDGKPASEVNKTCLNSYNLKDQDKPQSFINTMKSKFPGKTVTVHSIVVKDGACQQAQTGQLGRPDITGSIGSQYISLSNLTGGKVGSICDANYQAQLGQIGTSIVDQISNIAFECAPYNNQFELYLNGQPATPSQYTADMQKLVIDFTQSLAANTKIRLVYQCKLK